MLTGYARVSSEDQDLTVQLEALKAAGCTTIYAEKRSGTTLAKRVELERCLTEAKEGDTLIVVRLDRMARSLQDLLAILNRLQEKRVAFKCLTQPVDMTTPMGRMILAVLGAIAEFETDLRKERQREGIARAKRLGVYKGRPQGYSPDHAKRLKQQGLKPHEIAQTLGCSQATAYRMIR